MSCRALAALPPIVKVVTALALAALLSLTLGMVSAGAEVVETTDAAIVFAQTDTEGQALFVANCASCHQADGSGQPGVFPPLLGNPAAADPAYVEDVIRNGLDGPLEVLGTTYDATMFPIPIEDDEIAAIVAYVATLAEADVTGSPDPEPGQPREADAVVGQRLFDGSDRFGAGGPACRSCHTAGSESFWGGSSLGPDLTEAAVSFGGEAGLAGWLANPPAPTMRPLFVDHPLTEAEVDDLAAYIASLEGTGTASGFDQLLLAGLGGLVLVIGFMAFFVRGPQKTYVQELRSRS